MPLPPFRDDGWLPEGHHKTTWEEIEERFGGAQGSKREQVLRNLLQWRDRLRAVLSLKNSNPVTLILFLLVMKR